MISFKILILVKSINKGTHIVKNTIRHVRKESSLSPTSPPIPLSGLMRIRHYHVTSSGVMRGIGEIPYIGDLLGGLSVKSAVCHTGNVAAAIFP